MTEKNHYYTPRCDLKDPCNELANVILLWQTAWLCKAMRSSTGYATVLQLKQESKTRSCSAWHTSNVLTKYINRWVNTCYVPPNLLNFTCLAVCNGLQVQHQALLSHAPLNLPDLTHDPSAFTHNPMSWLDRRSGGSSFLHHWPQTETIWSAFPFWYE